MFRAGGSSGGGGVGGGGGGRGAQLGRAARARRAAARAQPRLAGSRTYVLLATGLFMWNHIEREPRRNAFC